jgi:hypothetical protein
MVGVYDLQACFEEENEERRFFEEIITASQWQ